MKTDEIRKRLKTIEDLLTAQQPAPMTLGQAADYLSISKSRLYQFTSKNVITYFKPTKRIFFRKSDLDAYLLRNKVASVDEITSELEKGDHGAGDDR